MNWRPRITPLLKCLVRNLDQMPNNIDYTYSLVCLKRLKKFFLFCLTWICLRRVINISELCLCITDPRSSFYGQWKHRSDVVGIKETKSIVVFRSFFTRILCRSKDKLFRFFWKKESDVWKIDPVFVRPHHYGGLA